MAIILKSQYNLPWCSLFEYEQNEYSYVQNRAMSSRSYTVYL